MLRFITAMEKGSIAPNDCDFGPPSCFAIVWD